jgi:hypothetical protein
VTDHKPDCVASPEVFARATAGGIIVVSDGNGKRETFVPTSRAWSKASQVRLSLGTLLMCFVTFGAALLKGQEYLRNALQEHTIGITGELHALRFEVKAVKEDVRGVKMSGYDRFSAGMFIETLDLLAAANPSVKCPSSQEVRAVQAAHLSRWQDFTSNLSAANP